MTFSFNCGDFEGRADTIEEMRWKIQANDERRRNTDRIVQLRAIRWGHEFGLRRVCECGLRDVDFHLSDEALRRICPVAERKSLEARYGKSER
jgi:hypothetical protein